MQFMDFHVYFKAKQRFPFSHTKHKQDNPHKVFIAFCVELEWCWDWKKCDVSPKIIEPSKVGYMRVQYSSREKELDHSGSVWIFES